MPYLKCEFCGKEFKRNNFQIQKAKHHFCSNECRYKSRIKLNPIIEHKDYIEILSQSKDKEFSILIDKEDYKYITHWVQVDKKEDEHTYYAKCNNKSLHRIITGCPQGLVVDHINHNGLDNRKSNLRICTIKENARNRQCYKTTGSKTLGITWDTKTNKWKVTLCYNDRSIHGGYYNNLAVAIRQRRKMEKIYFKEFAYNEDRHAKRKSDIG